MSTKDAETAYFAALSKWAETEMEIDPDGPNSLHGADAAAAGRRALEEALGGPEAVRRAVRGRPTLDPAGVPARMRRVRVPMPMDERAEELVAAGLAPNYSTLVRLALGEYLERHVAQEHKTPA